MLKKLILSFTLSICAAFALLAGGMIASAITVEDIWNYARESGIPEEFIQMAFNHYAAEKDPSLWTEEEKQKAMDRIDEARDYFTTGPQQTQTVTTTTTAAVTTSAGTAADDPGTDAPEPATEPTNPTSPPVTLTMEDGTTITRISIKEFIALSYDEKQAYIATFPPEQQQFIIDNFTPEERRSILKQLPMDQKLETINEMKGFMEQFGIKMTIEDVSDDTIKLTMHNENGEIIGKSSLGKDAVENTGYDRRWVYITAGGLFMVSLAAVVFIIRRSKAKENTANEKN